MRTDCARRVAAAESARAEAVAEAEQLRRALRNAVDQLQAAEAAREADGAQQRQLEELRADVARLSAEGERLRARASARPAVDVCGLWHASGIDADGGTIEESFLLSCDDRGRVFGCHGPGADPAEHFRIEDFVVKQPDSPGPAESLLLSFVQRYDDPDAMPTRWQARLEAPGMVGWWFTDADDDGVQDADENGGTFTAVRQPTPDEGPALAQPVAPAASAVAAPAAPAAAAAGSHPAAASDGAAVALLEERLAETEAAAEAREESYRNDLEAASARVDSLASASPHLTCARIAQDWPLDQPPSPFLRLNWAHF